MTTYLTQKEINVMGVQRTGQHAIIMWIIGHFNGEVCFKNGLTPEDPGVGERPRGITKPYWYFNLSERPDFNAEVSEVEKIKVNCESIILGTEFCNKYISLNSDLPKQKLARAKEVGFDEFSKDVRNVFVIRSPWNHLASVMSWKDRWYLKKSYRFTEAWCNMAEEYLGTRKKLPEPKIGVNFDEWFVNESYRKKISNKLGLKFSDIGKDIIMDVGRYRRGSSFDEMKYKEEANKMKVLNRWESHYKDPVYLKVLEHPKLKELAKEIYGDRPF